MEYYQATLRMRIVKPLLAILLFAVTTGSFAQTGDIVVPTGGDIYKVLVDKQGKYLYTLGKEKIIMWDKKTHVQLYTFYNERVKENEVLDDPVHLTDDGKVLGGLHQYVPSYRSTITGEELPDFKENPGISMLPDNFSSFLLTKNGKHYFRSSEGIREIDSVSYGRTSPRSPSEDRIIIPEKALERVDYYHKRKMKVVNNGRLLVYGDVGIQLWDLEKANLLYETKFSLPVRKVTLLKKRNWLLTFLVMNDKPIYELYDLNTGKYLRRLSLDAPPETYQVDFCVSEENNTIVILQGFIPDDVTGAKGKTAKLKLYDLSTGLLKKTFPLPDNLAPHYYSEKENSILLGNQILYNLNTLTGKMVAEYEDRLAQLTGVTRTFRGIAAEDRKTSFNLAYFADNKQLLTLDTRRMVPAAPVKLPANFVVDHIAATLSGDTVLYSVYGAGYFIKSLAANKVLYKPKGNVETFDDDLTRMTFFSDDGSYLYFNTKDYQKDNYTYNRLNLKTGVQESLFTGESPSKSFISADKKFVAFMNGGIRAGQIRLFNLQTRQMVTEIPFVNAPEFKGSEVYVKYLAVSKDSKQLLIIYQLNRNVTKTRVYDVAAKKVLSESKDLVPTGDFDKFFCNDDLSVIIQAGFTNGLIGYDRAGNRPFGSRVETKVTDVAFSDDGKTLYTTTNEQTIKAWDLKSNKLYGTLYIFKGGIDYVFVAPTGHFDGNEGGIKRLYYLKDRNVIPLDKIYEKAYTPNLYPRLLAGEAFAKLDIQLKAIPVVKITYAAIQRNLDVTDDIAIYQNTTGQAEITVNASSADDSIDEIRLFHNGKIVNLATRGLFVTDDSKQSTSTKKYTINLLPGKNSFRAIALNSQRTESQPDEIRVSYQTGNPADPAQPVIAGNVPVDLIDKNATMHLVVVGINQYRNEKMSLNYALADATSFKNEVEKGAKTVLTNIKTYFVTDTTADKKGITEAFAEVQKNAKPQDVFVFYYAGHGVISEKNKEFYLVPTDVTDLKNVDEALAEKGIAAKLLQNYAIDIQAQKQLFILDACQSAGAFEALLQNDGNQQKSIAVVARSTGTHWMAASGAQQFANEFAQLGHGAFTYVLLQALKGEAASNKMITVNGLKNFMQVQVPVLMKKYNGTAQYPASYGLGNDFPVEILK